MTTYARLLQKSDVVLGPVVYVVFFFNDTATTEIYTLSLHDALPIYTSSAQVLASNTSSSKVLAADTSSQVPAS